MKGKILFIFFFYFAFTAKSQNSKTTFGIQYKPIIPAAYFNAANLSISSASYNFNLKPKYSNSFGMVIRRQINKTFSLESGLNYTQRNFKLSIIRSDINLAKLISLLIIESLKFLCV